MPRSMVAISVSVLTASLVGFSAQAADFYVSAAKGDNGNDGSKAAPFAELDKALRVAKAGDTIHVAAGKYYGIGRVAASESKEAVRVLGGYDEAFGARTPRETMAILTGDNAKVAGSGKPRLSIIAKSGDVAIDGLVFDMAERNAYNEGKAITRKANPRTGANASLDAPTLEAGTAQGTLTITNCLVLNSTHTGIRVKAGKDAKVVVRNNWVVNTAGIGIELASTFHAKDGAPQMEATNNTVLFVWKYDSYGTRGGEGIAVDASPKVTLANNVVAFADNYGLNNGKSNKTLNATGNVFAGSGQADYWEGKLSLGASEMSDGQSIGTAKGNLTKALTFKVNPSWAKLYAARMLIDRNKVEADVKAQTGRANQLRAMLGLPQQAADVKADASVHGHPMPLEGAWLVAAEAGEAGAR